MMHLSDGVWPAARHPVCHSFLLLAGHLDGGNPSIRHQNSQDVGWPPMRLFTNNKKEWQWCIEALVAYSSKVYWTPSEYFILSACIGWQDPIVPLFILFWNGPKTAPFWFLYVVYRLSLIVTSQHCKEPVCILCIKYFPDKNFLNVWFKCKLL